MDVLCTSDNMLKYFPTYQTWQIALALIANIPFLETPTDLSQRGLKISTVKVAVV